MEKQKLPELGSCLNSSVETTYLNNAVLRGSNPSPALPPAWTQGSPRLAEDPGVRSEDQMNLGAFGARHHRWRRRTVASNALKLYPNTTCLGLPGRTAEKRPGVVDWGSVWGGSPMAVPLVVFGMDVEVLPKKETFSMSLPPTKVIHILGFCGFWPPDDADEGQSIRF